MVGMGSSQKSDHCSLLECFQSQHLSLVVPRYLLVAFPEKYISVWVFHCHLVSLSAFASNHLVVVVARSNSHDWATLHYPCPVGCLFGQPNSRKWQDLGIGEGV